VQWYAPVIPAIWEVEIGRILVSSQLGKEKLMRPHLNVKKLSIVQSKKDWRCGSSGRAPAY
jgi:hypothetical protein